MYILCIYMLKVLNFQETKHRALRQEEKGTDYLTKTKNKIVKLNLNVQVL